MQEREKQIEEMARIICRDYNGGICATDGFVCNYNCEWTQIAKHLYNAGYRKMPENMGEFSDGYHTFNELYHHRAVLFSVICNMFPEKAWKSKKHDTGDMYEGMFIVGIETEQGQATYHYDIEPYWDIFKVKELEYAPKYDGHTPSDAIARIGNLPCKGYRKQSENVIELPCKVGAWVYVPWCWEDSCAIATVNVEEIKFYDSQMHYMFLIEMESDDECFNQAFGGWKTEQSIGKTVFLTREEAEEALAKMKGGGE